MPQISSAFVRKMIEQAPEHLQRGELLSLCGLTERNLTDTWALVASPRYYSLLELLSDGSQGTPDFHVKAMASIKCEDLGAVGLAFKVAPTLRESLKRLGRYVQLVVKFQTFSLFESRKVSEFRASRPFPASKGAALSYEASFATIVSMVRESSGRSISPVRVKYRQSAVGDVEALNTHLNCPVEFNADREAIIFDAADLSERNLLADQGISAFFNTQLEDRLQTFDSDLPINQQVSQWASNVLPDGRVTIEMAANTLGISSRSLQRRLAESGSTFNQLILRTRQNLACQLLADHRRSLTDVAFLTGYSEQSTFNRAFKRWYGMTPGTFREQAAGTNGQY